MFSMILLAAVGCSKKPSRHFVLPVGFSGVFKIENGERGVTARALSADGRPWRSPSCRSRSVWSPMPGVRL